MFFSAGSEALSYEIKKDVGEFFTPLMNFLLQICTLSLEILIFKIFLGFLINLTFLLFLPFLISLTPWT